MEGEAARITVVIADDEEVAREGVLKMLATAPDIEVVGVAKSGGEAQQLVAQLHPQVLLLDLVMPGPRPAEIALWMHEHHPETTVLALTAHDRRPDTLDEDKTIQQTYQGPLDLQDGDVIFTGVELWQSNSNDVWLALRFRELNSDSPTPRILLAFRDSEGVAWLSGDTFLRDPASPRGDPAMQEFWFFVTFDEEVLRRDSRNKTEWFERVANSTIEVGLVKGKEIIVAGPGNAAVDGGPPLTYLHPVATAYDWERYLDFADLHLKDA